MVFIDLFGSNKCSCCTGLVMQEQTWQSIRSVWTITSSQSREITARNCCHSQNGTSAEDIRRGDAVITRTGGDRGSLASVAHWAVKKLKITQFVTGSIVFDVVKLDGSFMGMLSVCKR